MRTGYSALTASIHTQRQQMGYNSRRFIEEKLSWRVISQEFIS